MFRSIKPRWHLLAPLLLPMLLVSMPATPASLAEQATVVRIGVLAHRGKQEAMERWSPTADYLSERITDHRFEIVPVNLEEMPKAIQEGYIHFTLTNPGNYVSLETSHGVSRIATMQTREGEQTRVRYGAVIIARADRTDITELADLKGKSFMVVSQEAFGGFQMAWRELKEHGIDPFTDIRELRFAGFPQDKIIMAVHRGEIDAATVRAETLVRMIESGKVAEGEFCILNPQSLDNTPFPLSTRLYPEWPFAMTKNAPRELATRVAQALLSMPADHPATQAARMAGWTVPLDYSPVHDLMQTLQVGPYEVLRQASFLGMVKRYAWWFVGFGVLLGFLVLLNGYISNTNHKLKETERSLRREIREREKSQAKLARYRDTLEEQVATRTEDLKTTNEGLEKSRVALRALVRITSAPELSHDERMSCLLETGRKYFDLPVAVLSSAERNEQGICHCKTSGEASLIPKNPGPLSTQGAHRLIELHGEPLDVPDLSAATTSCPDCQVQGLQNYLGTAVLVEGRVHCTLEFAGTRARKQHLSKWDLELLKVMAQWIGDEMERQIASESQQRHRSELARVSRMSTIGEMAASLAHELNQPLTGAINYSSGCLRLLREGTTDTGKIVEGMERAIEGATLAANIIRNIRQFVQKDSAERTLVDLNKAVSNITALVMMEARRHDVGIELDLDKKLPPVLGNMIQLEQVILNFIRNSIDSMDMTETDGRQLRITTRRNGKTVQLIAADTGQGVPEEALPKIFDAFYSTKPDGMGIGLSISRSIVESHDGSIFARTLAGGGAEFSFELPIHQAA
jgi:signal transduction histidine kinase/ABC-type phosphate/phosphonate transport system substrate-binding protein